MAENDYNGSLAQQYMSFSVIISEETEVGQNFFDAMVFVDSSTLSGLWTGSSALEAGSDVALNSQTYTSYLSGGLLSWATGFFASNSINQLWIAAWDSTEALYGGMIATYSGVKYDAYFKTIYTAGLGAESIQNAACVELATLCASDVKTFSQAGFGTSFTDNKLSNSTSALYYALNIASLDAVLVYSEAGTSNPWLDQLGLTLGLLNGSGTVIGNTLDYFATSNRSASGASGANLSAQDVAVLKAHNIGYWATRGNGTGTVALYNPLTLRSNYAGAYWIVAYIDLVAAMGFIQYLTDPADPGKRRNNTTYQGCLGILNSVISPFIDKGGTGVLNNYSITAPAFANLSGGGSTLTVPKAWQADWLQGVHSVTVQGTLYIQG